MYIFRSDFLVWSQDILVCVGLYNVRIIRLTLTLTNVTRSSMVSTTSVIARYSSTFLQMRMILRTSDSSKAKRRAEVPCRMPGRKNKKKYSFIIPEYIIKSKNMPQNPEKKLFEPWLVEGHKPGRGALQNAYREQLSPSLRCRPADEWGGGKADVGGSAIRQSQPSANN